MSECNISGCPAVRNHAAVVLLIDISMIFWRDNPEYLNVNCECLTAGALVVRVKIMLLSFCSEAAERGPLGRQSYRKVEISHILGVPDDGLSGRNMLLN